MMDYDELKEAIDKVRGVLASKHQALVVAAAKRELARLKGQDE